MTRMTATIMVLAEGRLDMDTGPATATSTMQEEVAIDADGSGVDINAGEGSTTRRSIPTGATIAIPKSNWLQLSRMMKMNWMSALKTYALTPT